MLELSMVSSFICADASPLSTGLPYRMHHGVHISCANEYARLLQAVYDPSRFGSGFVRVTA